MFLPARSALQNWPSGTSLQQSLFRLILGWKPNIHATCLGTHIHWRACIAYHVAIRADMVLVDPEDRATPLRAHAGVCQPACPRIIFNLWIWSDFLLTWECFQRHRPLCHKWSQGQGWRTIYRESWNVNKAFAKIPWSSSDGFVVVIVPQVDALAGIILDEMIYFRNEDLVHV